MTSSKLFSLEGKIAVVTGAAGLLGRNHCEALHEAGATVLAADLEFDRCKTMVRDNFPGAMAVKLDVTDKDSVINMLQLILDKFGKADILVNNAAVNDMFENPKAQADQSMFENYPLELWQKSLDVNLTGVFLCSQVIGTQMALQGSGSIINIASTYGITAPDQSIYRDQAGNQIFYKPPAYSVTKGGVIMLTKYLAAYWGRRGVRINTLSPGGIENGQSDFFIDQYSVKTPLGRMANPRDYKGALVFLASSASSYMTGANLVVDGGWTCW